MIGELLFTAITPIVDLFPVIVLAENTEDFPIPYAVYRVMSMEDARKDACRWRHSVQLAVCDKEHDSCDALAKEIHSALSDIQGYKVSGFNYKIEFENEDALFMAQITFNIRKL